MLQFFADSGAPVPPSLKTYYKSIVPFAYATGPLNLFGLVKKVLVPIMGLFRVMPRVPTGPASLRLWAEKTTTLACENLMLAFSSHGYDTCPMEGFDEVRVRRLLNLPRDASVVMVISAGKRAAGGIYGPRIRFDSKLFIKEI
jgi:nitroreductase